MMSGYIQKRGNSYRLLVSTERKDGKKVQKWVKLKGNFKQRQEQATKILYEIQQGTYVKPCKVTVGQFMDKWLVEWSEQYMAPSTHRGFKQQVRNHIKPELGEIPLTSLTRQMISSYYSNRLKSGLSQQTVRHHRTMLHKAFEVAIEWGLINNNPVDGSSKLKVPKPEMETYNANESDLLLETAKKLEPEYYPMFVLSLHEGVRRSELCGLAWKDVDDLTKFTGISIKRKLFIGEKGKVIFGEPKTEKSCALIPLTPTSSQVLKDHYEYSKKIYQQMGKTITNEMLIFCHFENGNPYNLNTVTRAWSRSIWNDL